jgi:calcineurin-like phosphoesterase family protein
MHRTIIDNWNKVVTDNDVVFYLGDLCFGRPEWANNIIYALKGTVHYIMGNHDKYSEIKSYNRFASINDYVDLNILNSPIDKKLHFALMHYPIYSWNRAHHGSYMIHGHCHGNLHHGEDANFYVGRRVMDVGCNLIEYTPISYIEIINQLK